ncbi:hypothetical protein CVU76_03160 [Candidatus Dojkabacteria bacterium HGW-Dojkabacteria-1]|uniref:Uncharacterized protein n=1 Tax=Candidatus Dojkabacteria bacterium HGW-Dojkabacteria-1 TaxID=2013761 RepID=A0A2N2F493_9BACT|nr:MAG: hypothetical protein CVU76_03160 [Candidatus Dojkabacteria bacterium HGW-Dojkabacteria-1]
MDAAPQNMSSLIQNDGDLLQEKLDSFVKELQGLGLTAEQIETIITSLTATATKQTMAKISSLMDDEEFENWKNFVDTGANTAQQLVVLNRLLLNKTDKDLDTIHMEIVDGLIKNTLSDIANIKDLNLKISNLSPEEVEKAKQLLDDGDYEGADKIINKEE